MPVPDAPLLAKRGSIGRGFRLCHSIGFLSLKISFQSERQDTMNGVCVRNFLAGYSFTFFSFTFLPLSIRLEATHSRAVLWHCGTVALRHCASNIASRSCFVVKSAFGSNNGGYRVRTLLETYMFAFHPRGRAAPTLVDRVRCTVIGLIKKLPALLEPCLTLSELAGSSPHLPNNPLL